MHELESVVSPVSQLAVFPTRLGWFGLLGHGRTVCGLTIGHRSADKVRDAVRRKTSAGPSSHLRAGQCDAGTTFAEPDSVEHKTTNGEFVEADWFPDLRTRLQCYAEGSESDFDDCDVLVGPITPFQERVLAETRKIAYGQTITYGQLAARAGRPRAARAVGNVMAANTVPILIPCHRVVAAGGKWGGYSAPQGVRLKRRLLHLESRR